MALKGGNPPGPGSQKGHALTHRNRALSILAQKGRELWMHKVYATQRGKLSRVLWAVTPPHRPKVCPAETSPGKGPHKHELPHKFELPRQKGRGSHCASGPYNGDG
jgi:hypothetical protein